MLARGSRNNFFLSTALGATISAGVISMNVNRCRPMTKGNGRDHEQVASFGRRIDGRPVSRSSSSARPGMLALISGVSHGATHLRARAACSTRSRFSSDMRSGSNSSKRWGATLATTSPTATPTYAPTNAPSHSPTFTPTLVPTARPSAALVDGRAATSRGAARGFRRRLHPDSNGLDLVSTRESA